MKIGSRHPSLFRSDVQGFVKHNTHHLGRNPHTYARTIWRMPKMESLVEAVMRLNKEHTEEVNHEAARYMTLPSIRYEERRLMQERMNLERTKQ
jgi:hypothetical protein